MKEGYIYDNFICTSQMSFTDFTCHVMPNGMIWYHATRVGWLTEEPHYPKFEHITNNNHPEGIWKDTSSECWYGSNIRKEDYDSIMTKYKRGEIPTSIWTDEMRKYCA